jgi:hypothetical protein
VSNHVASGITLPRSMLIKKSDLFGVGIDDDDDNDVERSTSLRVRDAASAINPLICHGVVLSLEKVICRPNRRVTDCVVLLACTRDCIV